MKSMFRGESHLIGVELTARSVTLAQLAGRPGNLSVARLAYAEIPRAESATPEAEDAQASAIIERLYRDHQFRGHRCVSCVGARELFVQNVRVPQLPEEEIAKVARWEAEELLPYPVDDAEIRHLTAGSVVVDGQSRQEVILMACHGGAIRRHIGVLEAAGLQPAAIDVESTAILRGLNAESRRERCAYVALGERATNVIVAEGSQILFLKYVAVGAHQLDQAVARHLGLDIAAAARTRATVNAANELNPDDEIHRGVIDAVRHPLDEMASEIEMCLRYYKVTFRGRAIERVVLVGGDASPWLAEYLGQRLDTQYELGNPLASISWPHAARGMSERPWRWTIPLGLAMKPTVPALAAATA